MKLPRISLASSGVAIVIIAVNLAVVRFTFQRFSPEGWETFALLLLPVLDVLLVVLYRMRKPRRCTAGAIGFVVAGSAAMLLVFASCLARPEIALGALRAIGRPIALGSVNGLTRLLGNGVMQGGVMQLIVGVTFEILFPLAFFSAPPLCVALLGGWLARRLRTDLSIARGQSLGPVGAGR